MLTVRTELQAYAEHYNDTASSQPDMIPEPTCPVTRRGSPGRPPFHIPEEQIEAMIELGYTYQQMATIIGVSARTLRRNREQFERRCGT